jgi:hypothetical protein
MSTLQPLVSQDQVDRAQERARESLVHAVLIGLVVLILFAIALVKRFPPKKKHAADDDAPAKPAGPVSRALPRVAGVFALGAAGLIAYSVATSPRAPHIPEQAPACGADRTCIRGVASAMGSVATMLERPEIAVATRDFDTAIAADDCPAASEPVERLTRLSTKERPSEGLRRALLNVWSVYCAYCWREGADAKPKTLHEGIFCGVTDPADGGKD